jgi:hypothetical protein
LLFELVFPLILNKYYWVSDASLMFGTEV